VLQHIPALSTLDARKTSATQPGASTSVMNREALYALLAPFKAYIISGHQHELEHVAEGGAHHIVAGAVCGAWWTGPICYDGTPKGYLVVNGDDSAVTWRYQSTGRSADHQIRWYPRGADRAAPDDIVANVWAWDPAWSVRWFEDGQPRGLMSRRVGVDPLAAALYAGPALPASNPWVDPVPSAHLFYATPSRAAHDIVIEATDGFGRTYRERLAL
jgi:hypothetical protein